MIYLTKGQPLFNNEGMVVCAPTGYYEDGSSVACAMFHSVDEPVCLYEAKFIAYGDQVYNIVDEAKLLEEIKKIDPESLLGKTSSDVTVDKMIEQIKTVENPTPELGKEPEVESEPKVNPVVEKVETVTETHENGETSTVTKTTTIEENTTTPETVVNPEVVKPDTVVTPEIIEPETVVNPDAVVTPDVLTTPDTIVTPDVVVPVESLNNEPISMIRKKRKSNLV